MSIIFDALGFRSRFVRHFLFSVSSLLLTFQVAAAQGIHITLRANPTSRISRRYADVWADGNYAYLCSDMSSGVLIYDISNPDAPVKVANYAPTNSLDMEDAKVSNGIGYFASNNGGGVHIVDLSDPTHPTLITRITAATGGYDYIHNVAIDGTHLYFPNYAPFGSPAVQVWDVSNPNLPFLIRTIMTTDPKFIHDLTVENNRLYTAGNGGKTDIWDVSNVDTQVPVLLGSINSGIRTASAVPSSDGNFLFVTRELFNFAGDLSVYDISNPASAQLAYRTTGAPLGLDATSAFQPKVVNNLLYLTWDQAGLVVFDIANPASPVLIGNYDTWPAAAGGSLFDGGWGVYPFLGQDRILVSDRDTGLYILDATAVSAQPALLNFTAMPNAVAGSTSINATAYLVGRAPPGGLLVNLASDNPAASVPPTLMIPAGASSGTATVTTTGVTAVTSANLTASYSGRSKGTILTIKPDYPSSVKFSPGSVVGGLNTTGTVTMAVPAPVNVLVALSVSSGGSAVASIPASVTVLAGSSTANFVISTNTVAASSSVKISASANGTVATGTLTVTPNVPSSMNFLPASIIGGASSTGTVTLGAPANSATAVTLSVTLGNSAVASVPISITVPAGLKSTSFTVVTNPVASKTAIQILAAANGGSRTGVLTATVNTPTSVGFVPSSVIGGSSSVGKVTLGRAVVSDTAVTLNVVSGASAVVSMPSSIIVPAGTSSGTWTVVTGDVPVTTTVQVSATTNGGTKTGSLTATVNKPTSVTFAPNPVVGGSNSVGKVTFGRAVNSQTIVTLSILSGAYAVASIPTSIIVPAGSSSGTWTIVSKDVPVTTTVQVSATANGGSKTGNLTLNPNTPTSVSFTPSTVTGGSNSLGKVTFARALASNTVVTLAIVSGSVAVASLPSQFTVPAGSSSGTFTVVSVPVGQQTAVQVSATANGNSKTGILTVQ